MKISDFKSFLDFKALNAVTVRGREENTVLYYGGWELQFSDELLRVHYSDSPDLTGLRVIKVKLDLDERVPTKGE